MRYILNRVCGALLRFKALFFKKGCIVLNSDRFFSQLRSQDEVVRFCMEEMYTEFVQSYQVHNALIGFYPDKLQELVELCLLFGYKDLYRKYITFLQEAVIGDTRAGAITNIPPITPEQTIQIAQNTKQIKSNEALLMAYPSRDNHYYLAYWSKYEEYVRKTLAGQYQEAIRLALDTKDEWYIECIASTLVLMNKFDIAQEVANQYLTQNYRIEAFNIVKAIEYQRIGEWYISFSLIKEHFAKNISIFDLLIYIKGLNGLEPWGGYPYCDY